MISADYEDKEGRGDGEGGEGQQGKGGKGHTPWPDLAELDWPDHQSLWPYQIYYYYDS